MQPESHIFKGMKQGTHPINQENGYLWDAHNIRLTNHLDNTLLSITNEKGPKDTTIELEGEYVGHQVAGDYLIVFTSNNDGSKNRIYRIEEKNGEYKTLILFYQRKVSEESWNPQHPIESIYLYESELVQKVYWVDGIHQPRYINIKKPELLIPEEHRDKLLYNNANLSAYSGDLPLLQSYTYPKYHMYSFEEMNFVGELSLKETCTIEKIYTSSGFFNPGVIQYSFTYYNKYGAESNIFYTTPLQYISAKDYGISPEKTVTNSFKITINNVDTNYDYLRIYSIQRSSIDSTPYTKLVANISLASVKKGSEGSKKPEPIIFTDTGNIGGDIDNNILLYIGGATIIANTLTEVQKTLFLGNIEVKNTATDLKDCLEPFKDSMEDLESALKDASQIIDYKTADSSNNFYSYKPSLSQGYSAGFKYKEAYRVGIQGQFKDGSWSAPVYLHDGVINDDLWHRDKYLTIDSQSVDNLLNKGVKKIRTCVVFPDRFQRQRICQGILCPTVFNIEGRNSGNVFAQSSWFFRPTMKVSNFTSKDKVSEEYCKNGAPISFLHNHTLGYINSTITQADNIFGREVQNNSVSSIYNSLPQYLPSNFNDTQFYVDENIVTFHSPDIEFDEGLQTLDFSNTRLEIVGVTTLEAVIGKLQLQTSSPGIKECLNTIGHTLNVNSPLNGGMCSGNYVEGSAIGYTEKDGIKTYKNDNYYKWLTYLWHRTGSLNNDEVRLASEGSRTAVLKTKTISNLKFFNNIFKLSNPIRLSMSTPNLFNDKEVTLTKIDVDYLKSEQSVNYLGNVDTLLTTSNYDYNFYVKKTNITNTVNEVLPKTGTSDDNLKIPFTSKEPVRMRYKSQPHLVFSLKDKNSNSVVLLPDVEIYLSERATADNYNIPSWYNSNIIGAPQSFDPASIKDNSSGQSRIYELISAKSDATVNVTNKTTESSNDARWEIFVTLDSETSTEISRYTYVGVYRDGQWLRVDYDNHGGSYSELLFRISPNKFKASGANYLPGTKSGDYSNGTYIGATKIYKIKPGMQGKDDVASNVFIEITAYEELPTWAQNNSPAKVIQEKATSVAVKRERITYSDLKFTDTSALSKGLKDNPYLLIADIVRDINQQDLFGGNTEDVMSQNIWYPAGDPAQLIASQECNINLKYGDTWFTRHDCLKTYPFSSEDINQVVEIGSFLCESRINLDGRYDRKRGLIDNTSINPSNFNIINPVYSQHDNFFNYRYYDKYFYKQKKYSSQILWSKQKTLGEDTDSFTQILLASFLNLSGDSGNINKLVSFGNRVYAFQDKGVKLINFNSRVQIPTSDGIPIELTNSYKVDGDTILSDSIGCTNKWSIKVTPNGVYFIDSQSNNLYCYTGQELKNITDQKGFSHWVKKLNDKAALWKADIKETNSNLRTFYDYEKGDLYLTPGCYSENEEIGTLVYSEKLGEFVSFMSYDKTQAMFNYNRKFYSLRSSDESTKLYLNNEGEYNYFFGEYKPFSFSFVSNYIPSLFKTFNTISITGDRYDSNKLIGGDYSQKKQPGQPFDYIRAYNEYQDTFKQELDSNTLRKKFRIWRAVIPRQYMSNARIKNPWSIIELGCKKESSDLTILHNLSVNYTI